MAKDPYRFFRVEARELLEQLGSGLLGLEGRGPAADELAHLLRAAHTLKGAARVVRQVEIAELAHAIEDQLAPCRDGSQPLQRERVDAVLTQLDAIGVALARLPEPSDAQPAGAPAPSGATPAPRLLRTDQAELGELLNGLGELGRELGALDELTELLGQGRELALEVEQGLGRRRGAGSSGAHAQPGAPSARLAELLAEAERRLGLGRERIGREFQQARETAERLRLIPVAALFPVLERTCRDAAQSLGLQAELQIQGGELLLDGQVLELLQSALVQLVRNAVAHGIEAAQARRAAGKPECGRIELKVLRRGKRIAFRCSDDGRGIDFAAVRRAVLPPGGAEPGRAELLRLLFQGGVSTAATVNQIAGRGIGLDVVRAALNRLGGELRADSEPGGGTSVELLVPVALALFEALRFELAGQRAALPLEAVCGTLRVQPGQLLHGSEGSSLRHAGRLLPVVAPELTGRRGAAAARCAVLLEVEGHSAALLVDRLDGIEAIVLRPLPALCRADPLVLGCFLDLAGDPMLVLDPGQLVRDPGRYPLEVRARTQAPHPILVIDDSLTTRMLEQSILEAAGLPVETAASAEEGLELARRNSYSLFLVDVEMPGMDGFGFVECTRADPRLRAVPCVMVTSCDSPEHRARGSSAGAAAYLIKSQFDQSEFLQHIARLLARSPEEISA